ncbi:MAG: hypothetical protein RIT28_1625 [Pseudomonadota bacterium]
MARPQSRWMTVGAPALPSALAWAPAQADEPVDAAQAERAERMHKLRDAHGLICLHDDESSALPLLTKVARRAH